MKFGQSMAFYANDYLLANLNESRQTQKYVYTDFEFPLSQTRLPEIAK